MKFGQADTFANIYSIVLGAVASVVGGLTPMFSLPSSATTPVDADKVEPTGQSITR